MRAVGYLRVSGLGQVEGDGLARQRDAIARFARANGHALAGWFEDGGVSGATDLEDRPALLDALALAAAGEVAAVIVEHADRLARDLMVQEAIVKAFADAGVRILTADGFDLTDGTDPARVLVRQMLGAIAEFNKRMTVMRLKAARQRERAKKGFCEGRAPFFGHSDAERAIVGRMKRLRRAGKGYRAVANALNASGATTRSGKAWTSRAVYTVLTRWRAVEKFTQPAEFVKPLKP